MPKFIVEVFLDGFETPEEEAVECKNQLEEALHDAGFSYRIEEIVETTISYGGTSDD